MPAVVQFFVKVVEVPFVLCDGVPQLQFSWVVKFLDEFVYMAAVVQFFDKVFDVPVVLCDEVPHVRRRL